MATNYPGGTDSFVNPAGTSLETNPDHAGQHTNINDSMAAVQSTLGTTAGTSVLKHFAAGEFPVRATGVSATGTLQQTLVGGTINNFNSLNGTIGTLQTTNGTLRAEVGTITALVPGTVTGANSIPGSALSTNALLLAYTEITTDFTSTTTGTLVDVTNLAGTATVPAGGRKVRITLQGGGFKTNGAAGAVLTAAIREGGTIHNQITVNEPVSGYNTLVNFSAIITPSAGAHTYKASVAASSGTLTFQANNGSTTNVPGPAFILVELV